MNIRTFPLPGAMTRLAAGTLLWLGAAAGAQADITVGVILSTTGPAASLGKPAENTVKLWPDSIAGEKLRIIQMNDASDPTEASRQASKLITEEKVDVIVGSSVIPPSIAIVEVAGNAPDRQRGGWGKSV